MSQRLSDRLSIDQIGRRWAKENEKAAFGADDIAEDLVKAAETGEFEHPTHSREDAPPWKLTYKEDQEDGTVETKETEQPGVGPYRSTLSRRDGQPVNAIGIQNYIKAGHTSPGATDRETRRIVARETFLSVEGLRRWCDRSEFPEWAQLRGLSRPRFIDLASGDGKGQAPAVVQEAKKGDATQQRCTPRRKERQFEAQQLSTTASTCSIAVTASSRRPSQGSMRATTRDHATSRAEPSSRGRGRSKCCRAA